MCSVWDNGEESAGDNLYKKCGPEAKIRKWDMKPLELCGQDDILRSWNFTDGDSLFYDPHSSTMHDSRHFYIAKDEVFAGHLVRTVARV